MNELRFWQKIMEYLRKVPLTGGEVQEFAMVWNTVTEKVAELEKQVADACKGKGSEFDGR